MSKKSSARASFCCFDEVASVFTSYENGMFTRAGGI